MLTRKQARFALIGKGEAATPALIEALTGGNHHVRWEAAKVLSVTADPAATAELIQAMRENEDPGVRWLAAEGLIKMDKAGLKPLLETLEQHADSAWFRQGALHIVRTLVGEQALHDTLMPVLEAMRHVEPAASIPGAAHAALRRLK